MAKKERAELLTIKLACPEEAIINYFSDLAWKETIDEFVIAKVREEIRKRMKPNKPHDIKVSVKLKKCLLK